MAGSIKDFKELEVWKKSIQLVKEVYTATNDFPRSEAFGLTNQIRRSAVSIPSNIAEGQARNSTKEFIHFLSVAPGSCAELETQLIIAGELCYLTQSKVGELIGQVNEIQRMLNGLMNALS